MGHDESATADASSTSGGSLLAGRERTLAALLAVAAGLGTLFVSGELFPYHSLNHDEAVYLHQAAMLLEGRLTIAPPVSDAFRPWFFVERPDGRLYPKYAPVPAAMFAVGKLVGGYRLALAGIAAGNVACVYALGAAVFDRRRGLLAAAFVAVSPLFVLQSAVFLPYAPTTLWNLLFALAYLRADRTGSRLAAAAAGGAVGIAFFARPFTAVLFATPFVVHACWSLRTGGGSPGSRWLGFDRAGLTRASLTAALGLVGVLTALAYNAVLTGAPFRFPYEAFAPADGIGFGTRRILGYSREYTPELAVRANLAVLARLFGRWVAGGPVGTALVAVGLAALLRRGVPASVGVATEQTGLSVRAVTARRAALAGTLVTVSAGNVFFWGNLNILGSLGGANGLIDALGPYYHFDLLAPTAVFAADGACRLLGRAESVLAGRTAGVERRRVARGLLIGLLVVGVVGPSVGYAAGPVERNADVTRTYESAYAVDVPPDAVVFLPTPLGDWLGHPFQAYRNDPTFDEGPVFAFDRPFAVIETFPDRPAYRYVFRGEWAPLAGREVTPHLQPVAVRERDRITLRVGLDVPAPTDAVSVRLSDDDRGVAFAGNRSLAGDRLGLGVRFDAVSDDTARVRLDGPIAAVGEESITVSGRDEITLRVFTDYGAGAGLTYRLVVPVRVADGQVAVATPEIEVCKRPQRCGGEAAYVPGASPRNVSVSTALVAGNETSRLDHRGVGGSGRSV